MITKGHFKAVAAILAIAREYPKGGDVITFIGRQLEQLYLAENPEFDVFRFEMVANLPVNTGDKDVV